MKASLAIVAACIVLSLSAATGAFADNDPAQYPMPPGFHTDRAGCYVPDAPAPALTTPVISAAAALAPRVEPTAIVISKDGIVMKSFSGRTELTYRLLRARYFLQQHDVPAAMIEYRLAAATARGAGEQPSYHDLITRLPLSVVLFRAGHIADARAEWRTMLSRRIADARNHLMPMPEQPPAIELLAQRRLDLLAEREMPGGWAGFYRTGAGQHMARGFQAVRRGDGVRAAAEWRCAAHASPEFEVPHLMLGYVSALGGDSGTAKREWISTLEGSNGGPGDMMSITGWQFDAMEALLRYT